MARPGLPPCSATRALRRRPTSGGAGRLDLRRRRRETSSRGGARSRRSWEVGALGGDRRGISRFHWAAAVGRADLAPLAHRRARRIQPMAPAEVGASGRRGEAVQDACDAAASARSEKCSPHQRHARASIAVGALRRADEVRALRRGPRAGSRFQHRRGGMARIRGARRRSMRWTRPDGDRGGREGREGGVEAGSALPPKEGRRAVVVDGAAAAGTPTGSRLDAPARGVPDADGRSRRRGRPPSPLVIADAGAILSTDEAPVPFAGRRVAFAADQMALALAKLSLPWRTSGRTLPPMRPLFDLPAFLTQASSGRCATR